MKRTILSLACALIAPLAFAQTSTTTSEQTTTTNPSTSSTETTTTTTSSEGTVTTFTPGKTIVVKTTAMDPVSYLLGKTVHYVNKAGKEIEASMVRPGARVHVYYDGAGETRTVTRVMVDE
jgi:ABC-type enterochelin transport system substrate-binding protein